MPEPLTIDLETNTPDPAGPDFRIDEVRQVGWLPWGRETAYWSECFCNLPSPRAPLCHNGLYDLGIMARLTSDDGASFLRSVQPHDTMLLAYAQGEQDLSLKGLGQKYLNVTTVPWEQRHLMGDEQYLAQDLFLTRGLFPLLMERNHGTSYDIDRQLIPVLIEMSYRGYRVNQSRLEQAIETAERTVSRISQAWEKLVTGVEVVKQTKKGQVIKRGTPDIGSPTQVAQLFGLKNADKNVLQQVMAGGGEHGVAAQLIQQHRQASKRLTTYFYPLRGKENVTGLFNLTPSENMEGGTVSGRLSSERINMQNLTDDIEVCLHAPDGMVLLRADYPQIELRIAAEVSDDEYLLAAFREGRDLHRETRDLFRLCGPVPCPNPDCVHRVKAKNYNFGAGLYGGEAYYVSYVLGRPVSVVAPRIKEHRELWNGWWSFADAHWREVQHTSYSQLPEPFLQKRFIPLLAGDHARKAAINHIPQGFAAYITKAAMLELWKEGYQLVNQVHDAIMLYIPIDADYALEAARVAGVMSKIARKYLPRIGADISPTDIKISKYWDEALLWPGDSPVDTP